MAKKSRKIPLLYLIIAFELGVGGLGLLITWLTYRTLKVIEFLPSPLAFGQVFAYGSVMFVFAAVVTSSWGVRQPGIGRIYRILCESFLGGFIQRSSPFTLFLVALSAGLGEEILFREGVQGWLGLWGTGVLFGLLHAVTPTYFLIATAIGTYLGAVFEACGENLFVPVLIHTVYDFLAFMLYKRRMNLGLAIPLGGKPQAK